MSIGKGWSETTFGPRLPLGVAINITFLTGIARNRENHRWKAEIVAFPMVVSMFSGDFCEKSEGFFGGDRASLEEIGLLWGGRGSPGPKMLKNAERSLGIFV